MYGKILREQYIEAIFTKQVYKKSERYGRDVTVARGIYFNLRCILIEEKIENAHVTFDNFLASTPLMQSLYENKMYSTATVRSYNLPRTLKNLMAKKGKPKLSRSQYNNITEM